MYEGTFLTLSLSLSLSQVPLTARKASKAQRDVDPNEAPRRVALVNAKYVTYGRITRDLAVVFFTSSSSLIRRYYLIKGHTDIKKATVSRDC